MFPNEYRPHMVQRPIFGGFSAIPVHEPDIPIDDAERSIFGAFIRHQIINREISTFVFEPYLKPVFDFCIFNWDAFFHELFIGLFVNTEIQIGLH